MRFMMGSLAEKPYHQPIPKSIDLRIAKSGLKMPANTAAPNAEFRDQYARAREIQADYWAEEIIEIADDGTNDYIEKENKDGSTYEAVNSEHINRSRLRVDTRKWLMARQAPKKYGDRLTAEHSGPDGAPIQHHVDIAFVSAKTPQD
jgi:hypothetical protein